LEGRRDCGALLLAANQIFPYAALVTTPGPSDDRFAFWVRFVCGALLGAFLALRLMLRPFFQLSATLIVVSAAIVLVCGFAAAKFRDDFWYEVLGRWRWK
jgi:hypothetical protein